MYLENLPHTEPFILDQMINNFPSEFETIFSKYDEYASENLQYDYCDVIANFYFEVFNSTDSNKIKLAIINTLPVMGYYANRYHVGEVFAMILSELKDPELIEEVHNIFKNNSGAANFCINYCDEITLPMRLMNFEKKIQQK